MLPSLFAAKSTNVENTCIKSANSSCTRDTYTSNTYIRDTCAGNAFSAISVYIKSAGPHDTSTKDAGKKNAYTRGIYTIKYLRIYLQSFSISKIELFYIG